MMQHLVALSAFFTFKRDEFLAQRDERGATAVEYGLLVVLIAAVIVGIVFTLGGQISEGFQGVSDKLDEVGADS